jgi:hypothetical protein
MTALFTGSYVPFDNIVKFSNSFNLTHLLNIEVPIWVVYGDAVPRIDNGSASVAAWHKTANPSLDIFEIDVDYTISDIEGVFAPPNSEANVIADGYNNLVRYAKGAKDRNYGRPNTLELFNNHTPPQFFAWYFYLISLLNFCVVRSTSIDKKLTISGKVSYKLVVEGTVVENYSYEKRHYVIFRENSISIGPHGDVKRESIEEMAEEPKGSYGVKLYPPKSKSISSSEIINFCSEFCFYLPITINYIDYDWKSVSRKFLARVNKYQINEDNLEIPASEALSCLFLYIQIQHKYANALQN